MSAASIAEERYRRRLLVLSIAYAATLLLAVWLFRDHRVAGPLAVILALLPALAVVGVFVAVGHYLVEERDEYLRILMARRVIVASGVAMAVTTLWGFLAAFGLVPALEAYWVAGFWFGGLGIGRCAERLGGR